MADVSDQWQRLTREQFARIDDRFLDDFRAPGARNKFVAWDPFEPSSRYFKFLLLTVARRQPAGFFAAYRRISNRHVGNPLTVRCGGCDIDADYLAAVEEVLFLESAGALRDVRSVVEIGAGFGRTCHAMLSLFPQIERYTIVDLPAMLQLSDAYLRRVAPGAPVTLVASDNLEPLRDAQFDLAINIDSFQEMPPAVIDGYMRDVVTKAPRFYCKNPVGKYAPGAIGLPDASRERLMDVFRLGYCQRVIDIFDEDELTRARAELVAAYRPSGYAVKAEAPMDLFPYFHHVLYAR